MRVRLTAQDKETGQTGSRRIRATPVHALAAGRECRGAAQSSSQGLVFFTAGGLRAGPSPAATAFQTASASRVGATRSGIPGSQLNDNLSGIARLDLNLNEQHTLSLRGDYRVSEQDATRIGALSVPTFGGDSRTKAGGLMLTFSSRLDREILGGTVINEAKVYATAEQRNAAPYVALPRWSRTTVAEAFAPTSTMR